MLTTQQRWARWCVLGLGVLQLPPEQFWQLSLTEWHMLMSGMTSNQEYPMSRKNFEQLLQQYPDHKQ